MRQLLMRWPVGELNRDMLQTCILPMRLVLVPTPTLGRVDLIRGQCCWCEWLPIVLLRLFAHLTYLYKVNKHTPPKGHFCSPLNEAVDLSGRRKSLRIANNVGESI